MIEATKRIISECQQQIDIAGNNAQKSVVMNGKWGKKDYRTLYGVRGEIVLERERDIVIMFPAKKLKEAAESELSKLMV